jgi:hypothetical protein
MDPAATAAAATRTWGVLLNLVLLGVVLWLWSLVLQRRSSKGAARSPPRCANDTRARA